LIAVIEDVSNILDDSEVGAACAPRHDGDHVLVEACAIVVARGRRGGLIFGFRLGSSRSGQSEQAQPTNEGKTHYETHLRVPLGALDATLPNPASAKAGAA